MENEGKNPTGLIEPFVRVQYRHLDVDNHVSSVREIDLFNRLEYRCVEQIQKEGLKLLVEASKKQNQTYFEVVNADASDTIFYIETSYKEGDELEDYLRGFLILCFFV